MFSLDENKLEVIYKTYSSENYYTNVTEGTIKRRGSKKVNTNVCFFEKLV